MTARTVQPEIPFLPRLAVGGFKSMTDEVFSELHPLMLLAGAKSSGKSSDIQQLSSKQTALGEAYDRRDRAGGLRPDGFSELLGGPNEGR